MNVHAESNVTLTVELDLPVITPARSDAAEALLYRLADTRQPICHGVISTEPGMVESPSVSVHDVPLPLAAVMRENGA